METGLQDPDATPLLDRAYLAQQTFDDAALARELLDLFAGQCRRLLPGIVDRSLADPERADLAHTLKGAALGIGALRIARLSAAIEDALRAGAAPGEGAEEALTEAVAATLAVVSPAS